MLCRADTRVGVHPGAKDETSLCLTEGRAEGGEGGGGCSLALAEGRGGGGAGGEGSRSGGSSTCGGG